MSVLASLARAEAGGLAVLVDPARTGAPDAVELARRAAEDGAAALLIGNSFGEGGDASALARALRAAAPELPVLQFPATAAQLVAEVDAILFLSLISGRNAQYLIEEHVRAIPFLERHPEVEVIPTAYCLVDGGRVTSVEAVSQTRPLPADKPELLAAHLRAGMLLGLRATYIDAGSGAGRPVAPEMIRAARDAARGPLFVGGGVRSADGVRAARAAGADYVVVGTRLEQGGARAVREFALAARA